MIDAVTDIFGCTVEAGMRLDDLSSYLLHLDVLIAQANPKSVPSRPLEDHEYLYQEAFPDLLYKSFLIALVIFLEQELKEYCKTLKKHLALDLGIGDFRGDFLERFRLYASRYAGLNLGISNDLWQDIKGVCAIRNFLVHSELDIESFGEKKVIMAFSQRHGTPEVSDFPIRVDKNTCVIAHGILKTFIEIVYQAADKRFSKR